MEEISYFSQSINRTREEEVDHTREESKRVEGRIECIQGEEHIIEGTSKYNRPYAMAVFSMH
jgi:hypothetical protein